MVVLLDAVIRIPPFVVRLRSEFLSVASHVDRFYSNYHRPKSAFVDFDVRLVRTGLVRSFLSPQVRLLVDDLDPFLPLPACQAAPMLEWGLNWAIASRPLGYLVIHAAVLAKGDSAVVLPGVPGAGKSTLCASLSWLADWRVLSDELAILDPVTGALAPNPRPICLKNQSIDIVNKFGLVSMGPSYLDTRKGTVSHASIPAKSVLGADLLAKCRWVVFPRFSPNSAMRIDRISRADAFVRISEQSFNKERMGEDGFEVLSGMLDQAKCFEIEYGSTADALKLIDQATAD